MGTNGRNSTCSGDVIYTAMKLGSLKVKVWQIMILSSLMTYLLLFLPVFGAWRRRSSSLFLKFMLRISYTTPTALSPYILGMIQEVPIKDKLLIIWGMLLLIVNAFPDSFSADSPEDITQWMLNYIQFQVKLFALLTLWSRKYPKTNVHSLDFWVVILFTLILSLKSMKRFLALKLCRLPSIEERAKFSEIYMASEQNLSPESDSNPVTMKGYHYFVEVAGSNKLTLDNVQQNLREQLERNDVVTLEKVWNCPGRLLTRSGDPDNRLKDICLSYSLMKILYLKIANYALPVEAQPKARKLILEGLLCKNENDRAFRVIEVELKLLYELIYTNYRWYAKPLITRLRALELVLLLAICGLIAFNMSRYANSLECVELAKVCGFNLEVMVTYVLLVMIVFADIAQLWMAFSSELAKVAVIVNYVANKYSLKNIFAEKLVTMVYKPRLWKSWAGVLGQYSLIEARGYGTKTWISVLYPDKNWDFPKARKAVHLSKEVKGAVLDHLRTHGPNLENGRFSLRHYHLYEKLSEAYEGKHLAEDILVWHIATSYCQHKPLLGRKCDEYYRITNDLSDYLAYLVAFAPRLLPGPHFEPQFHFRRVMKEAREAFKGCKKVEDRIGKLNELAMQEDQKIIVRGARLGKQLLQLENETHVDIWKILAEFWSEMALCAATSGEVKVHLETLANGGEFITHLWALLHHAGYSPAHPAVYM